MGEFNRFFYADKDRLSEIDKLKNMPWFEFLRKDIECGEVFPAVRPNNEIHFYYYGKRICEYMANKNGEPKAKSFCPTNGKSKAEPFCPADQGAYYIIKEKCKKSGTKKNGELCERAALSELYRRFSPYRQSSSEMILLDIEIGFPQIKEKKTVLYGNTQVDLLFLNKSTGKLYFVEAKEAMDRRIKKKYVGQSAEELFNSLEVSEQLNKYDANLNSREYEIIAAYQECLDIMSEIFGREIYSGKLSLHQKPKLLVYGKSSTDGLKSLEAI